MTALVVSAVIILAFLAGIVVGCYLSAVPLDGPE